MSHAPTDKIERIVARGAVSAHPEDTIQTVAETMTREGVGAVLVRGGGGKVLGILSERDIVKALADEDIDVVEDRASDLMTASIEAVSPEATIAEVASLMVEGQIRHAPVVDDAGPVGVVSIRDVLAAYLG